MNLCTEKRDEGTNQEEKKLGLRIFLVTLHSLFSSLTASLAQSSFYQDSDRQETPPTQHVFSLFYVTG